MLRACVLASVLACTGTSAFAQSNASPRASIAIESDVLAYGLAGYSGLVNVSLASGLQIAAGVGRYDVPAFLLEGDANDGAAHWTATATSVQVVRATYRFRKPMRSGPAVGAVLLNQRWRLASVPLGGTATFRPMSVGITGGYYLHLGRHLYAYPTAAFTYTSVRSGTPAIRGTAYTVDRFGPNASLHVGWEWGL
jgi:hypothetical protein